MNNDLISRSALLELYADTDEIKFDVYNVPVPVARQNILDMPTIEAEPVRHGRWVTQWCDNNMIGHEYAECSVCGCSMLDTNQFWNSKYCPNCGAKMDGDDHDQA